MSLSVKILREKFEKKSVLNKPLTPDEFVEQQKKNSQNVHKSIIEARQKASTYNMTMRAMHIKSFYGKGSTTAISPSNLSKNASTSGSISVQGMSKSFVSSAVEEIKRSDLRMKARKFSLSLQLSLDDSLALSKELTDESTKGREKAESKDENAKEGERKKASSNDDQSKIDIKSNSLTIAIEEKNDRIILESYLKENYPQKFGEVDKLMQEYRGHLDVLFEELARAKVEEEGKKSLSNSHESISSDIEKFNFQETESGENGKASTTTTTNDDNEENKENDDEDHHQQQDSRKSESETELPISFENVLTQFYTVFAPYKLGDIPVVMKHFKSREIEMVRMLELKYDVTFMDDGSCIPNETEETGDPFLFDGKDAKRRTLRERLSTNKSC